MNTTAKDLAEKLDEVLGVELSQLSQRGKRLSISTESIGDGLTPSQAKVLDFTGLPESEEVMLTAGTPPIGAQYDQYGRYLKIAQLRGADLVIKINSGRLMQLANSYGEGAVYVNSSLAQFAETAWRYHFAAPIVREILGSDDPDTEEIFLAAARRLWDRAVDIDDKIDLDETVSFWFDVIHND